MSKPTKQALEAAEVEKVYVSRWPGRVLPVLSVAVGSQHQTIARFVSDDARDLFWDLVKRGLVVDDCGLDEWEDLVGGE